MRAALPRGVSHHILNFVQNVAYKVAQLCCAGVSVTPAAALAGFGEASKARGGELSRAFCGITPPFRLRLRLPRDKSAGFPLWYATRVPPHADARG